MDPNTQQLVMGAAGAGGGEKLYVEDVFSTWLYTGNGSTQAITNGIDLSGKGGLTWIKSRSGTTGHRLVDTVRGATKSLECNSPSPSAAEATESTGLTSFSSTGFSIGADADYNTNAATYASWTFRKAEKFFDVVTYTGTGANRTIAHSLGSVPGCIIVKRTDAASDWQVYHRGLANTEYLVLNSNLGKTTGATRWNSTTPTSAVFNLGTDATVNASGGTYVAYLFAHDAGGFGNSGSDNIISCGSYTGNGSATGPVITLGWEPQWLLIKRTSSGDPWLLVDNIRGLTTASSNRLYADTVDAEVAGTVAYIDLTPTGFQPKNTTTVINGSGSTYIYIAIRRGPMKTPTDATKVFNTVLASGASSPYTVSTNFPVDLSISGLRGGSSYNLLTTDRLRGGSKTAIRFLLTSSDGSETSMTGAGIGFDSNTSIVDNSWWAGAANVAYWSFRRAPGFFDAVCYTGTGAAQTLKHNLGVAPELILVKRRSGVWDWGVYAAPIGANKGMYLNLNTMAFTDTSAWNNTSPTSTEFTVGTSAATNSNAATHIAYLFASCPGVSKVGSYTGNGGTLNVDCGFTSGARFVLIKRTDQAGNWWLFDTARGIVAANDPYLLINLTNAETTTQDHIDPLSSGFQMAPDTNGLFLNANGATYLYLAIA